MTLDPEGNPRPLLLEPLELTEFEQRYVQAHPTSTTRTPIFQGYQNYLRDFRAAIGVGFKQWVNGSYTTDKLNPQDVDVINFVPYLAALDEQIFTLAKFKKSGGSRDTYRVDGHIIAVYPPDNPRYGIMQLLMNSWASDFGLDEATGNPKPVVELLFA